MKYIYLILFITVISPFSCKKFLEEKPNGTLTSTNFYKTAEDAQAAITSVYDGLNDQWNIYYRGIYLLAELPTDNATCGIGVANPQIFALDQYTYGGVNDRIEILYKSLYKTIANANVAIDKIPDINFDALKKNQFIGEAKFIRGLLYFNLVRLFGGVPLVIHEVEDVNNVNQAKESTDAVYEQIISDLKFAEENLPVTFGSSDRGRATSTAASGLLAKVYLTLQQYENAKIEAEKVLNTLEYGLLEDYSAVFSPSNRFNKELIFAIQNKGNTGSGNGFSLALFLPRSTIKFSNGSYIDGNSADVPTEEFYNSFKTGDLRKNRTFFTKYNAGGGEVSFAPHWFKFFDSSALNNLGEGTLNYPVIRYADILLTYAEAINNISGPTAEAYEALNKVRRRAYGKEINIGSPTVDLSGLSQSGFNNAILDERRWEFGFENQRWFDLKRTGKLLTVLKSKGYAIKDYNLLFPFPQRDLDVNKKLIQNEGYEN